MFFSPFVYYGIVLILFVVLLEYGFGFRVWVQGLGSGLGFVWIQGLGLDVS